MYKVYKDFIGVNSMLQTGIYKHYKGNLYQVFHVATHSETREKVVVYQCLYGDYSMWVRPYEMFIESVKLDNDKVVPRFEFLHSV